MILKLDKGDTVLMGVILGIFIAALVVVLAMPATSGVPMPLAQTNTLVRPPWMTNALTGPPLTNVMISWTTKAIQVQQSSNLNDWESLEIDVTNYAVLPMKAPGMYYRVATGFTSNDNVFDQSRVYWQTGTVVNIKPL